MKKASHSNRPDWKSTFPTAGVRRTIEYVIQLSWKCGREEAAQEFERALDRGELEEIKIGLSGDVTAYKLKEV